MKIKAGSKTIETKRGVTMADVISQARIVANQEKADAYVLANHNRVLHIVRFK